MGAGHSSGKRPAMWSSLTGPTGHTESKWNRRWPTARANCLITMRFWDADATAQLQLYEPTAWLHGVQPDAQPTPLLRAAG
jgi:hypothetical protein